MTDDRNGPRPAPRGDEIIERDDAELVLRRAAFAEKDIDEFLGEIVFPAPLSVIERRGERFGISQGSLTDRLGGSP